MAEAVPVSIQNSGDDSLPIRVEVVGSGIGANVQAQFVQQRWEYRSIRIIPPQDPVPALNAAGSDGWETTGITFTEQGRTVVVMRRPR
jgi:hypothetical protein